MPPITPEPAEPGPIRGSIDEAESALHDLVVIGGGIYGVAALLEASRRGLSAILIEKDDFGGGVSWSSHRIVHGGLRYLQSLDLARFKESVRERRWFLEMFPEQVEPLSCLVPLTNEGTRRPSLFRVAAAMNNTLNSALGGSCARLGGASVVGVDVLRNSAPDLDVGRVAGVGRWQDGLMVSSERILIGMLRLACGMGARAIAGLAMESARREDSETVRVVCRTGEGREVQLRTRRVLNCAGPASGSIAAMLGGHHGTLFEPLRAFNLLLDVPPRLGDAVALKSDEADGRMLFIVPSPAGLAIGTWEEPADGHTHPTRASVERLLGIASRCLGRDDLHPESISAVWSGLLPLAAGPELTPHDRPVFVDHGASGGLGGAYSVSGVKYTTARLVAERAIRRVFPDAGPASALRPVRDPVLRSGWFTCPPESEAAEAIVRQIVRDEAPRNVDDVCRRRTAWYASPDRLRAVAPAIGAGFGLDDGESLRAVDASIRMAAQVRE